MKASLNWIKDYLNFDIDPERFGDILTAIGLEVEGMEKVESIQGGLEGIVAGLVKTCVKHPNADRLSLTTVDIGQEDELQIVCGAPNVAEGQKVWVAQVGTTLYSPEDGSPWQIKKAKVRGEFSEGMICSEDEIGLGDLHEGIMVLEDQIAIGTLAKDYYNIVTDYVYDIGLTPNRSDATCHLGVADDVYAYLKINESIEGKVVRPDIDTFKPSTNDLAIEVTVENSEACPRYAGVAIQNMTIGPSPEWLKTRLQSIGVRPINNVVDATNFVLHEMGQPLHAFDMRSITNREIIVKTLPDGTVFKSLDEVDRKLSDRDLIICDGDSNPMCIGGVFGGLGSGVKDDTTSIFLESAHFDAVWVRRTSTKHGLRTDAAKVFEKGSDPNIAVEALKRAALLIAELTGGQIASEIVDIYPKVKLPVEVDVSYSHVTRLIGVEIEPKQIHHILKAMNMVIVDSTDSTFRVAVPTNKADVTREADVIEEILRIYGFNHVPIENKMKTTVSIAERPSFDMFRKSLGDFLVSQGMVEMMGLSLTQSAFYSDEALLKNAELVPVMNTSNTNLDIMRPDMVISALEAVSYNQNRQQTDVKLFEFGRSYRVNESDFVEKDHLTLTISGLSQEETWLSQNRMSDYYTIKRFVESVLKRLGLERFRSQTLDQDVYLEAGQNLTIGQQSVVRYGRVKKQLTGRFDIRNDVYLADFDLKLIYEQAKRQSLIVEELSKFPSVTRDIAFIVSHHTRFEELVKLARKASGTILKSVSLFDVYENVKHLGPDLKSYGIRLEFEDLEKTLTDDEIDGVMNKLISSAEAKLGARIR